MKMLKVCLDKQAKEGGGLHGKEHRDELEKARSLGIKIMRYEDLSGRLRRVVETRGEQPQPRPTAIQGRGIEYCALGAKALSLRAVSAVTLLRTTARPYDRGPPRCQQYPGCDYAHAADTTLPLQIGRAHSLKPETFQGQNAG